MLDRVIGIPARRDGEQSEPHADPQVPARDYRQLISQLTVVQEAGQQVDYCGDRQQGHREVDEYRVPVWNNLNHIFSL